MARNKSLKHDLTTKQKTDRASFFFFSSRRRHTRSLCDWSSDVCSSDLLVLVEERMIRCNSRHGVLSEGGWSGQNPSSLRETPIAFSFLVAASALCVTRAEGGPCINTILHERSEERRVGKEERAG